MHAQKVEKLKGLCLQYATSIQLLMPSIDVSNSENTSKSGKSRSRINKSQYRDQQLKLASENVVMSESILYVSIISIYLWSVEINSSPVSHNINIALVFAAGNLKQRSIQSSRVLLLHWVTVHMQSRTWLISHSAFLVCESTNELFDGQWSTCLQWTLVQYHTVHVRLQRCIAHPNQGRCMFVSCEWLCELRCASSLW